LSKRKDSWRVRTYAGDLQQEEIRMRVFERIRLNLGFMPAKLQNDSKEVREVADASPHVPPASERMCCGHCSGNVEAHVPELPGAR
jgi:hypothetical protein